MKLMFRSVVSWYKMIFMVYFEFWLSWFWFGRKLLVKMAKSGHFCIQPNTPTPRQRSLYLGEPGPKFAELSGSPRQTSPPRRSIAPPKRTC